MMPEMDGIALCKKVKGNTDTRHIPVILLTARSSDEDKAEGFDTGADAYIAKPFNVELLKKRAAGIIENRVRLEPKAMDAYDKMTRNSAKRDIAPKPEDFGNVPNKTDGGSPSEN